MAVAEVVPVIDSSQAWKVVVLAAVSGQMESRPDRWREDDYRHISALLDWVFGHTRECVVTPETLRNKARIARITAVELCMTKCHLTFKPDNATRRRLRCLQVHLD